MTFLPIYRILLYWNKSILNTFEGKRNCDLEGYESTNFEYDHWYCIDDTKLTLLKWMIENYSPWINFTHSLAQLSWFSSAQAGELTCNIICNLKWKLRMESSLFAKWATQHNSDKLKSTLLKWNNENNSTRVNFNSFTLIKCTPCQVELISILFYKLMIFVRKTCFSRH